jgi:hypothetical protein
MLKGVGVPHYHWYHVLGLRIPIYITAESTGQITSVAQHRNQCVVTNQSGQQHSEWVLPFATPIL